MKNLILILGALLIVLNTLTGLILSGYAPFNYLLADLSLAVSTGLLYFLAHRQMAHGFKIGLALLFSLTGMVRCICVALASTVWENNVYLLVALTILIFEMVCMASAGFFGKR